MIEAQGCDLFWICEASYKTRDIKHSEDMHLEVLGLELAARFAMFYCRVHARLIADRTDLLNIFAQDRELQPDALVHLRLLLETSSVDRGGVLPACPPKANQSTLNGVDVRSIRHRLLPFFLVFLSKARIITVTAPSSAPNVSCS